MSVTSKNDSSLNPSATSAPVSGRVSKDLQAEIDNLQALLKAKKAQRDAEMLDKRIQKQLERDENAAKEIEAIRERIYRVGWAVRRAKSLKLWEEILVEFKTDSVNQYYTEAKMKERREARIRAEAAKAEAVLR